MVVDAFALAIAALGVGLIAFMRGAFGGGFAVIGIRLLSLAMDRSPRVHCWRRYSS